MPPPTGVVRGPLMATRNSRMAATVSSGSHFLNWAFAFSPAKTSYQATERFPSYAFSTAASNTRTDAFQMSRPVPSPSMKGIMGRSGTRYLPLLYSIFCPLDGTGTPLNDAMHYLQNLGMTTHYKEYSKKWGGTHLTVGVSVRGCIGSALPRRRPARKRDAASRVSPGRISVRSLQT